MQILQKVSKIGNGKWVLIPKEVANTLGIEIGDKLEIDILQIHKPQEGAYEEERYKSYRCLRCEHRFDSEDELPECNSCGSVDLEIINNGKILKGGVEE